MHKLFSKNFGQQYKFKNIFIILSLIVYFGIGSPVLGQTYNFDDGTSQGWTWHMNDPYNNWDGVIFVWDDYVDYPDFPYDELDNNLGSISIQTPVEVVDSPESIEFEFRSPDLSGSTEWQNAAGWTAQLLFLGDMWPGDPFPGSYVELTTGHGQLVDEPLDVWTGSGWQEITTVFPADLAPFSWISLRFNYPEGLEGVYGGIFLDNVQPLAEIPQTPISDFVVLDGYHNSIPMAWAVPENQGGKALEENNLILRPEKSAALTGYNIYRSQYLNQSYSQITSGVTHQYFRDYSVSPGQTYYYRVTAVYDEGESEYSEAFQGQAITDGLYINSDWTGSPPTIDGVINTEEWADAESIDITHTGQEENVTLYIMNNSTTLYIAVDNAPDQTLDDWDNCSIFLDANHDGEWPATATSSEGMIRFYWDNASTMTASTYMGLSGTWPDNLTGDEEISPTGTDQAISLSSGNIQYEISMDFNTIPLNASGGDLINLLIFVWDNLEAEFNGLWPEEAERLSPLVDGYLWSYGPFAYGELRLAQFPSGIDNRMQHDLEFFLSQNYPNPFNPTTTIKYNVGANDYSLVQDIDLSIFNLLGQKVCTLISQKQSAGFHEVTWNGNEYPSGLYYYRLQAGEFVQTKRMLLIK
jgi:hypothetical protein